MIGVPCVLDSEKYMSDTFEVQYKKEYHFLASDGTDLIDYQIFFMSFDSLITNVSM
jgi:hypothetical protein